MTEEKDVPTITETGAYTLSEGNGSVIIEFKALPNVHAFLAKISAICEETRNLAKTRFFNPFPTPQSPATTPEKPKKPKTEKPLGPVPKVKNGRPSAWEYKFIKECMDFDDLIRDYHRKFPKTVTSKEELKELWGYYHPKAQEKRESEQPSPRTEADPAPGKQIGIGSKVVQVNGNAPAPGIGTVIEIKKDGACKVQFFNHVKVLPTNHFALATVDDVKRAKNGAS